MEERTLVYLGSTVVYKTVGQGMPVVLLHGFGEDSNIWQELVMQIKNNYRLIIPDIPGSGQSSLIKKEAGLEDYADCLNEILQKEKTGQAVIIGHSMGGYIALAFAEKYPASLIALGLFHSSAYADDDAKVEARKKGIAFIRANGVMPFLETSIPGLFYDTVKSKADIDSLLKKGMNFSPEALTQYYQAMIARPDRTNILRTISTPVLFILGEHDKAVPFKQGLQQSHLPLRSYVNILRNSAHMGMLEEKERSLVFVTGFLQNL